MEVSSTNNAMHNPYFSDMMGQLKKDSQGMAQAEKSECPSDSGDPSAPTLSQ